MDILTHTTFLMDMLTVSGIVLAGAMTPGPDFIATVHTAASGSKRAAFFVVAGISVGSMIWAILSLVGLGVLFATFAWAYLIVKFAGAAYLLYLGFLMMRSAYRGPVDISGKLNSVSGWSAFRLGLLTDLSNPKTAVFFSSLFVVIVPPAAPLWEQFLMVLSVGGVVMGWYSIVVVIIGMDRVSALYKKAERLITGMTGGLLTLLGLKLAADR